MTVMRRSLVQFSMYTTRREPIHYLSLKILEQLVNTTNKKGQTPLHRICDVGAKARQQAKVPTARAAQVVMWLAEYGADVNVQDERGVTPVYAAFIQGNIELATILASRGADLDLRPYPDADVPTPGNLDAMIARVQKARHPDWEDGAAPELSDQPAKMLKCTYVSLRINKTALEGAADIEAPYIAITLLDAARNVVERPQYIRNPPMVRSSYIWWARTWHMQVPLARVGLG